MSLFQALVVREVGEGFVRVVEERQVDELPEGEVLIRVRYSSLNYKDGLSASGNRGVTKAFPHTPGIDAAGEVVESSVAEFAVGDKVVVTGYDLGMNTSGGFGQYIRVPAYWLVKLPQGLTVKESMGYGTAGFTAALSVYYLVEGGVKPDQGEVFVTGATGGVGCLAVAMLAKLGYEVVAVTGKASEVEFLKGIGASRVAGRDEVDDDSGRPVLGGHWAGGVDTVGGNILSTLIKATQYHGVITCCGMVAGSDFQSSVFPFILRGVKLMGVDSVLCPMDLRLKIWAKISGDYKIDSLEDVMVDRGLDGLSEEIDRILAGQMRGRVVVDLDR